MDWKAHIAIAVLLGAAVSYFFFPDGVAAFAAVAGVAGLLPDLDLRKSKGSQLLYAAALVFAALAAYANSFAAGKGWWESLPYFAAIVAVLAVADFFIRPRHRGVMHSILFLLLVCMACYALFGMMTAFAVFVGYSSHLLADKCIKLV